MFILDLFHLFHCMRVLPTQLYLHHMSDEGIRSPGTEVTDVINCHVSARDWTRFSARATNTLNY